MRTRSVTGAIAAAAALFALYTTAAQAAVVELVLKPCDPGVPKEECGAKLNVVDGNATFTFSSGQVQNVTAGNVLSVNGNSQSTITNANGTILAFGATGSVGGGGGVGTIDTLPTGGSNAGGGPPGNSNPPPNNNNPPPPVTGPGGGGGGNTSPI